MDSRNSFEKDEASNTPKAARDNVYISDPNIDKAAMDAARNAKPRVRVLRRRDGKPAKILVTGCQGSGETPQERAAALFEQIAKECPDGPPDAIFFLGDNLYENGAKSPSDKAFIKCFHEMYGKKFPHLAPIPCILIPGNHDGNYIWATRHNPNAEWGKEIELREVAHSYLPDENFPSVESKIEFANRTDYYFDELPKYNFWNLFDSYIIDGTQHFLVNSNSYSDDYVDYKNNQNILPTDEINQAEWIEKEYKKARGCDLLLLDHPPLSGKIRELPLVNNAGYVRAGNNLYYVDKYANTAELLQIDNVTLKQFDGGLRVNYLGAKNQRELAKEEIKFVEEITGHVHGRKIIFDQHQGPYTCGKRAFYVDFDTANYPINKRLPELQKILNKGTVSHNDIYIDIYLEQDIHPDLFNVAHDHFVSIFNNKKDANSLYKFIQLTLGGGGQDKQSRKCFTGHPFVAQHMKSNGCCIIREDKYDPKNLLLEIHTDSNYPSVKPYKMLYTLKNEAPVIEDIRDKNVEDLRNRILDNCDSFLNNLKKTEPKPDANTPTVAPVKPPKKKSFISELSTNIYNKVSNGITMFKNAVTHDQLKAQEVIAVHNMMAFFNQSSIPDFADCCKFLKTVLENLPNNEKDTQHVLYKTLASKIFNTDLIFDRYNVDLESVLKPNFVYN